MADTPRSSTAEVIDLNQRRKTAHDIGTHFHITANVQETSAMSPRANRNIDLEELYSADTKSGKLISRCRELLHSGLERIQAAQEHLAAGDEIGADQQVMLLQGTLPELFLCRSISEGLSIFVLALHYALVNQRGVPLDDDQIFAIRRGLTFVREHPFLSINQSLDLIDGLSNENLFVDPPEAARLTDVFAEPPSKESAG